MTTQHNACEYFQNLLKGDFIYFLYLLVFNINFIKILLKGLNPKSLRLNEDIRECLNKVKMFLNHVDGSTCVNYYIDPRIFASWCYRNKVKQTTIESNIYYYNVDWELALQSMDTFKDFEF